MAHRTKVNGTAYEIGGGKTKVNGTAYGIDKGKTKINGTAYEITFSNLKTITFQIPKTDATLVSGCTSGRVYTNEFQAIKLQVAPTIETFADLAASSEYNTFAPIAGGHSVKFFVHTNGSPALSLISAIDGVALDIVYDDYTDALELNSGDVLNFTFSDKNITFLNYAYGTWSMVAT